MNIQMKRFASAALVLFAALAAQASDAVKVACIGDSITYGLGLADRAKESYPAQLQKMLEEYEPGKYEVRNFGNSGRGIYLDSMRGNEKRGFRYMPEHKAALEWKPDIVICNLGINDNGEYIKEYTGGRKRGQFESDYLALLEDYRKANPKVKFAIWTKLSPLAEGQKFYRSPEPFLMQADLEAVAKKMDAVCIDMQEPLREKMDEIFARDKIHPNAEGAHIIAELTFAKLFIKQFPCALIPDIDSLVSLPRQVEDVPHEVWLCVGQSNMQKGWNEFNATPQEKERVNGEMARLAKCEIYFWDFNDGKWRQLTPENALRKSAFGVSFAIRRAEARRCALWARMANLFIRILPRLRRIAIASTRTRTSRARGSRASIRAAGRTGKRPAGGPCRSCTTTESSVSRVERFRLTESSGTKASRMRRHALRPTRRLTATTSSKRCAPSSRSCAATRRFLSS